MGHDYHLGLHTSELRTAHPATATCGWRCMRTWYAWQENGTRLSQSRIPVIGSGAHFRGRILDPLFLPHFDKSITLAVHIHAILLFSFLGLLVFQPLAIRHKVFSIHRKLGKLTNILMPFILIFSVAMLWKEYHEHLTDGATMAAARNDEFLSAVQLFLLGSLYGLALSSIRSRDVAAHMRYMICIVLVVLPAGLARTLGYWFSFRQSSAQTVCLGLIDAFLLALIGFDKRGDRPSRPYVMTFAAYLVIEAVWLTLGRPV